MLPRLRRALLLALCRNATAALLGAVALAAAAEMTLYAATGSSPAALAELAAVLMTWLALVGGAWGVGEGFHLGLDLAVERLPRSLATAADRLARGCVATFGVLLAGSSAQLVVRVSNTLPATGWSAGAQYLPGIVAGTLIGLLALTAPPKGALAGTGRDAAETPPP